MVRSSIAAASWVALMLPFCSASLYSKNSPVLQLDEKTYRSEIAASNYTSIVEFYAPWCGHCKNLQGPYEQAAKSLSGLAKVAAVNCDDDVNKAFCGKMQIQGFPTLKIVKPGKAPGKPMVEDYQGQRTSKGIVSAVKDKIKNHVKRLDDGSIDSWIDTDKDKPKAILFSEKSLPTALLKALAIDFLGSISVGQIRKKDKALCKRFGVTTFPSILLLPGGDAEPVTYDGKLDKQLLIDFLSQAATPNRDARKPGSDAKAKPAKDTKPALASDGQAQAPLKGDFNPITPIAGEDHVGKTCLQRTSGTCILVFEPEVQTSAGDTLTSAVLTGLTGIRDKLASRGSPFVYHNVLKAPGVRAQLGVGEEMSVIAVNAKRGWIKRYSAADNTLEEWFDALRLGEGKKEALAEGIVADGTSPPEPEEAKPAAAADGEDVLVQVLEDPPEPEAAQAVRDEL